MPNTKTDRKLVLHRLLVVQGAINLAIAFTWLYTETRGRLDGVSWLNTLLGWIPGDAGADWKIGVGWLVAGVLMIFGGKLGCRSLRMENIGFFAGLFWPLLVGFIFLIAFATGEAPNGWVSTISFTQFASAYIVLASLPPAPSLSEFEERLRSGPIDLEALQQEVGEKSTSESLNRRGADDV